MGPAVPAPDPKDPRKAIRGSGRPKYSARLPKVRQILGGIIPTTDVLH